MIHATAQQRTAAERLLDVEAAAGTRAGTTLAAARVSERFRTVLTTLLGAAGFHALLARAVTLAKAEDPALTATAVKADGSLEGLPPVAGPDGARRFGEGEVVLVAHVVGLLVTFIGEALMLQVVKEAWPKVRLGDLDFDKGTTP